MDHSKMGGLEMGDMGMMNRAAVIPELADSPAPYDADVDFAKGKTPHYQAVIDMAKVQLEFGNDPEMRKLAEESDRGPTSRDRSAKGVYRGPGLIRALPGRAGWPAPGHPHP